MVKAPLLTRSPGFGAALLVSLALHFANHNHAHGQTQPHTALNNRARHTNQTPYLRASAFTAMSKAQKDQLIQKHVKLSGRYYKARYRHYYVYHAVNAEDAFTVALQADTFYQQFKRLFKKPFKYRKAPTIYVLANRGDYVDTIKSSTNPVVDPGISNGIYIQQGNTDAIYLYPQSRNRVNLRVVKHEAAHQLFRFYTNTHIPNWLTEGIAVNLETWEHTRQHAQDIALAPFLTDKASILPTLFPKQGFSTLATFHDKDYALWKPDKPLNAQYSSAWAIIHTLLSSDDGRRLFNTILDEYRQKKKTNAIFTSQRIKRIDTMVDIHLRTQVIPTVTHIRKIHALINKPDYPGVRHHLNDMRDTYGETLEYKVYDAWLTGCLAPPQSEKGKAALTHLRTYATLSRRLPRIHQAIAEMALRHGDKRLARQHAVNMAILDTAYTKAKQTLKRIDP